MVTAEYNPAQKIRPDSFPGLIDTRKMGPHPLFSARMFADLFPDFKDYPDTIWTFNSTDETGSLVKISLENRIEDTRAIMETPGGRIIAIHTAETAQKALFEAKIKGAGKYDFSEGIALVFKGKFWHQVGEKGVMHLITDANNAPRRTRRDIANLPIQGSPDFEKWIKISRAFKEIERAIFKANLSNVGRHPRLF